MLLVMQRRVIVPPELGYGKRGMSEIPVKFSQLSES
jgi:FKBP-type peptidyl-prolyl cis-trans isomerase